MNASHEWLSAFLPGADLSVERMRDLITARCCTVDDVVRLREDLADVVVGRVVEAAPHPDSDHLWVTRVDAGLPSGELLDVVCGAPNVRAGASYPFAPAGSTLPGGLKLEKRKIRGAISNGMLCSARELGLGQDHEGILELDTTASPGTPFLAAVRVGDTRLVIDVTPNRPDLLSHLGLARELGAAIGMEPALPNTRATDQPHESAISAETILAAVVAPAAAATGGIEVSVEDSAYCPRYMGAVVRGVTVAPSPEWLASRLTAIGSRPINNVVDITNYVLHELGQPMHAFDAGRLAGAAIVVRRARQGETLLTLDGVERTLDQATTVIADAERAQAIAGVIGGGESEVTSATADVFLEVAYFDPARVRRTRRRLGVSTDASYRFERGVDFELAPLALARAVEMLMTIAGGQLAGAPVDLLSEARERRRIELRPARVSRLLGVEVEAAEIEKLLGPLGYSIESSSDDSHLAVGVPSWRPDVLREVDLVEEVARLRGYDSFSAELRAFRPGTVPDSPVELASRRIRAHLVATGLVETRPMPFVRGAADGFVRVANPLAENEAYLRRELLDTLARRAEYNFTLTRRDVRLFEIGSAFLPSLETLPTEDLRVAMLVTGHRRPPHWTEVRPPDYDEWDAKGLALELATVAFPNASIELRPSERAELDAGLLWTVVADGRERGTVRRLALDAPVWAATTFGIELSILTIDSHAIAPGGERRRATHGVETVTGAAARAAAAISTRVYLALPTTPAADFDLALVVPNDLPAARVEEVIRRSAGDLLERLTLFDEYRGEGLPAGQRSLAWRLTFRNPERTLRDKEIAGRREKLLRTLEGELGVRQRTT